MEAKSIEASIRQEKGKGASRKLRSAGFIPCVVYSHGETEAIKIKKKDFSELFKGKISESVIFDLKIGNKKDKSEYMTFIKDYQSDPVTGEILHIDLFKVTKGEKIQTQVPVEIFGNAVGVKKGGVLEVDVRELEIECLPKDLPEKIEVDITDLEVGDSIHVKDLKISDEIKLLTNPESVIAAVHVPRAVVEEVEEEELGEGVEGEEAEGAEEISETSEEESNTEE